ncbi:MAG: caspase family protein [Pseudomonadota bacterium]
MRITQKLVRPLRITFAAAAFATFSVAAQAPGDFRIALVIGNSAYPKTPLSNPANDAKAMTETLRGLGFTVVEVRDGSKAQIDTAINSVSDSLKGKQGIGMLYYAGHGLQVDSRNYIVPVDARMTKTSDIAPQTIDVGTVIAAFKAAGNRMNILVLDACRDNPFGDITTGKGLAPLDAPSGTFLAYATAPGNVAEDGDVKGGNGLYTQYLLQELKKPQASIENVFKRVRFAVRKASNGRQIPWESTSLEDEFQFNDGRVVALVKPTAEKIEAQLKQEKPDWDRIKNSSNADDFYAFIQKYPSGPITEEAHARINLIAGSKLVVQEERGEGISMTPAVFRVGDEYVSSGNASNTVQRVRSISGSEVVMDGTIESTAGRPPLKFITYYTPDGSSTGSEQIRFDPPIRRAPAGLLQPGQRWLMAYEGKGPGGNTQTTGDGRVIAREKITVPAGTFDTVKVTYQYRTATVGQNFVTDCTVWIAPSLPVNIRRQCGGLNQPDRITELLRVTRAAS